MHRLHRRRLGQRDHLRHHPRRRGAILFGCEKSLPATERAASQIRAESPSHNATTVIHGDTGFAGYNEEAVEACIAKHGRI